MIRVADDSKARASDPIRSGPSPGFKHVIVGLLGVAFAVFFWRSRMDWDEEMRLWRAVGDAAFALFSLALLTGPLAMVWRRAGPLVAWRRALGIWFALFSLFHAYLVWDGWARWDVQRLFGYEDLSAGGGPDLALTDPGFGLANLLGLVALFWVIVIAAVSSDKAMGLLGARAWKHVQQYAYVVFYLVGVHVSYFLFVHYDLSLRALVFRQSIPEPNWFRWWFVGMVGLVMAVQFAAFVKNVLRRQGRPA